MTAFEPPISPGDFDPGAESGDMPPWEDLIASVGISSLIVVTASRLGTALRGETAPEDVVQDVLEQAWRKRDTIRWQGLRAFRAWMLTLIDHRIADLRDQANALKRGGPGIRQGPAVTVGVVPAASFGGEPVTSGTPSRVVLHREHAALMLAALDAVPEDCREVVRLRLFEEMTAPQIGAALSLGESAVRHRLRRGADSYRRALAQAFSTVRAIATGTAANSASGDGCSTRTNIGRPRTP